MDTEYLKKVGIYLLVALLSIGIVFYAGYHIYHTFTREVETQPAKFTELNKTIKSNSFVFRTETVLTSHSSSGGSIVPSVADGELVKKKGTVVEIFTKSDPSIVSRIQEIDDRILLLNSTADMTSVSLKGSAKSEMEIYEILSDIRNAADDGDASSISTFRSSLISLLNKRNILMRGNSLDVTKEINDLQNERATLRSSLGSLLDTVSTTISGYFYSNIDGYENVFIASDLEEITYTNLMPILNSSPDYVNNAIGKIVTNPRWYLVCLLDVEYKNTYSEGDSILIKLGETDIKMDVSRVLTDPNGIALILTTDVIPSGYAFTRSDEAELVEETFSGLSVPENAVRIVDGQTGVYILDQATIRFRRIEIIYRGETEYIVKENDNGELEENEKPWLSVNDAIITSGKGLYEGRVIGS